MDWLTWLLRSNDDLWRTETEPGDAPVIAATAAADGTARTALPFSAPRSRAGAFARAVRDTLAPEAAWREAANVDAAAELPQALETVRESAARVRRLPQEAQTPTQGGAVRRTGTFGSPFGAEETAEDAESAVSMAEISRFFERDARRYG